MKTLKVWNSVMSLPMNEKFASHFCMLPKVPKGGQKKGYTPVYLNVYDLTAVNGYVYWAGLGIFHSGVEVHGVEYAFGAHDHSMSGVFEVEPRHCPGFRFRKSILIGKTCLDPVQVREFMEQHSVNYSGDTYHLIVKNCNHFCNDVCYKLTGKSIPRWVNRLAKIGTINTEEMQEFKNMEAFNYIKACSNESLHVMWRRNIVLKEYCRFLIGL